MSRSLKLHRFSYIIHGYTIVSAYMVFLIGLLVMESTTARPRVQSELIDMLANFFFQRLNHFPEQLYFIFGFGLAAYACLWLLSGYLYGLKKKSHWLQLFLLYFGLFIVCYVTVIVSVFPVFLRYPENIVGTLGVFAFAVGIPIIGLTAVSLVVTELGTLIGRGQRKLSPISSPTKSAAFKIVTVGLIVGFLLCSFTVGSRFIWMANYLWPAPVTSEPLNEQPNSECSSLQFDLDSLKDKNDWELFSDEASGLSFYYPANLLMVTESTYLLETSSSRLLFSSKITNIHFNIEVEENVLSTRVELLQENSSQQPLLILDWADETFSTIGNEYTVARKGEVFYVFSITPTVELADADTSVCSMFSTNDVLPILQGMLETSQLQPLEES